MGSGHLRFFREMNKMFRILQWNGISWGKGFIEKINRYKKRAHFFSAPALAESTIFAADSGRGQPFSAVFLIRKTARTLAVKMTRFSVIFPLCP